MEVEIEVIKNRYQTQLKKCQEAINFLKNKNNL